MKYLFTLIFALLTVVVYAQIDLPKKDGKIYIDGVLPVVDSAKKDVLYKRAKKWFVTTYRTANDVILFDDPEAGEFFAKRTFTVKVAVRIGTREPSIDHTITIAVKDGKYRYIITDFVYKDGEGTTIPLEEFPKMHDQLNKEIKTIIFSRPLKTHF